jgi:hypothetical protein
MGPDELDEGHLPAENGKISGNRGPQRTLDRPTPDPTSTDSASVWRQGELSAVLSASLTAELHREIEGLRSADEAALWAQRRLAAKNALSAADAERIEQAFQAKLATFATEGADEASVHAATTESPIAASAIPSRG